MTWAGRLFRSFGRKVICTCTDPERCPMFGERRQPIHLPTDLNTPISPQAQTWIDALPSASFTVQLANCPPGEHDLIDITAFGHRHRHYLCGKCSGATLCLHDPLRISHIDSTIDCPQCITEAEETAP